LLKKKSLSRMNWTLFIMGLILALSLGCSQSHGVRPERPLPPHNYGLSKIGKKTFISQEGVGYIIDLEIHINQLEAEVW